jgi:hypothetical protein
MPAAPAAFPPRAFSSTPPISDLSFIPHLLRFERLKGVVSRLKDQLSLPNLSNEDRARFQCEFDAALAELEQLVPVLEEIRDGEV